MRKFTIIGTLLLLSVFVHDGDCAETKKGYAAPFYCPIFVLDYYPPDALYYCDEYATGCEYRGINYWFGTLSTVPYLVCHGDCADESHDGKRKERAEFPGLARPRPLTYMHEAIEKVGDRVPEEDIPTTSAGTLVDKKRKWHFVEAKLPDAPSLRYFKVIEYKFSRAIATGNAEPGKVVNWESKFVAFEVEVNPANSPGLKNEPVFEVAKLHEYVWRGRIKLVPTEEETVPVLILLYRGNLKKDR